MCVRVIFLSILVLPFLPCQDFVSQANTQGFLRMLGLHVLLSYWLVLWSMLLCDLL